MLRKLVFSLMVLGAATQANAAGTTRLFRAQINETLLRGYVATPQTGWTPTITYGVATDAAAANQQIFALATQQSTTFPGATTAPTTLGGFSLFSLTSNSFVARETLPSGLQVSQAECTLTNPVTLANNLCPSVYVTGFITKSLPGRIVISGVKQLSALGSAASFRSLTYVFDPAATVATDRWFLAQSVVISNNSPAFAAVIVGNGGAVSPVDTKYYLFSRLNPTATNVHEIFNK